jgi:hypothetical protein
MIKYHVRSRYLVDLINDIKAGRVILSPHFQRKLVWREMHKVDFIKTILLGLPFPEIFISRGTLDVETMASTSCVVDGQQRMNSIREFIDGEFRVDGKFFAELNVTEKEEFLKYEIAVIDLDLPNDDSKILEIFQRLNRTFYALSTVEKIATEYASSEFMLTAKLICGDFRKQSDHDVNVDPDLSEGQNPNVTSEFTDWANDKNIKSTHQLLLEQQIFTRYEMSRMVQLMYVLNLMSTMLGGFYNRNEKVSEFLETYSTEFPAKDEIVSRINGSASFVLKLKAKPTKFWFSKSTSFSLLVCIDSMRERLGTLQLPRIRARMEEFASKPPADYSLAAKEAVNNKRERSLRDEYIRELLS